MKILSNRSDILRQLTYRLSAAPCNAIMAFLCFTLLSTAVLDARPLPVNERHSSFGYGQMLASPFPQDDPAADFPRLPSGVNGRFGNEQSYRVASQFFLRDPGPGFPRLPMTSGVEHPALKEKIGNGPRVASSISWSQPATEFPSVPSVLQHSGFEGIFGNEHMTPLKFSQNELPSGFPHLPSVVKHSAFEKWSPFTTNEPATDAMNANGLLPARYSEGEEILHPDYEGVTTHPDPHHDDPGVPGFEPDYEGVTTHPDPHHDDPGVPSFEPCC